MHQPFPFALVGKFTCKQVAKLRSRFDDAHRAWLQEVVTQVLPKRVAACESALHHMGFTIAPPEPPPPLPTSFVDTPLRPWQHEQAAALEAKRKKEERRLRNNEEGEDDEASQNEDTRENPGSNRNAHKDSKDKDNDDDEEEDTLDDAKEAKAADEADFNAVLPPLPLGPRWTALEVARSVRRRLPTKAMSPDDSRRVAGALFGVNCDGEAVSYGR